ncbi:MAG: glycosyltransferase [Candidatus Roizmanbacteria bacterium]|nr:glycosyltransferase [Candidatus Roizmanbacteria bacterium]
MKKAVIVLPTYNERENILTLVPALFSIQKLLKNWHLSVLVVDDNSPDKTAGAVAVMQKKFPQLFLISGKKEGLGKAYQRGFAYALKEFSPDVLFEMDADWSHDPKKIPIFLQAIDNGSDMVIGSRYMKGGSIPQNWAWYRKIFSIMSNLFVRIGFMHLSQKEWTNGYRAIRSWVVEKNLPSMGLYNGYVFQIAFLDKTLKLGARISEIPVHFTDRNQGESKINAPQYVWHIIHYVLTHSSFIRYMLVGIVGFSIDFMIAYLFISFHVVSKVIANMISAEIAIISNFTWNNLWSFSHKRIKGTTLSFLKQFFVFNLIASGSILIQGGGLGLLLKLLGDRQLNIGIISIQSWIVYKIFIIAFIIIPYSYLLYNKVVWKKSNS